MINKETLAAYIKSLDASAPLAESSQFDFLNLDELAAHYGARWPVVRTRIFETCEQFIAKRIGDRDLLLRAANGFLVLPHSTRTETAVALTRRIETELKAFFLGSEYLQRLKLEAGTCAFSLDSLVRAGKSKRLEQAATAYEGSQLPDESGAVAKSVSGLGEFELEYAPIWAASSSYIAMCVAMPIRRAADQVDRVFHEVLEFGASRLETLQHDLQVLKRVGRDSEVMGRAMVTVPVHYRTLLRPQSRSQYIAALAGLPPDLKQTLGLRIMQVPSDAPSQSYLEISHAIRSSCRRLFMDIDFSTARMNRLEGAAIDGLIVHSPRGPDFVKRCSNSLTRFTAAAKRAGLVVAMSNCASTDVLSAAVAMGITLFSGPLFPPPTKEIWAPCKFHPLRSGLSSKAAE